MRRFQKTQYLALPERAELAANLGLTQTQGIFSKNIRKNKLDFSCGIFIQMKIFFENFKS